MIGFGQPLWLLAIPPAIAFIVAIGRSGRSPVSRAQHRLAVMLRSMAVTLVLTALALPTIRGADDTRSVLFLVDRSESISASAVAAQDEYLEEAMAAAGPGDQAAVAVFGGEVRVDSSLSPAGPPGIIRALVDGSSTDIAGALRSGAALLPTSGSRRIVVLTDVVPTTGDPRPVVQELADRGIAVDVVTLETGRGPDALVESVRVPPVARIGDNVNATIVVRSNQDGPARINVIIGDETRVVETNLVSGANEVEVSTSVTEPGFLNVTAELEAAFDEQPANNRAQGVTRVLGSASVAVVEGKEGDADQLVAALTAAGMAATEVGSIPDEAQLLGFDAVMLVNVPAPEPSDVDRLRAFVEDLGRGLVVVGGDQAYGMGRYEDSALEDLLPVRSNPDDLLRRQPVAEVLVIDTSGSMARCHCNDGDFLEGGVNKTDLSRAGAALAIEALSTQDRVGVVAFGAGADWVIPFGAIPSTSEAEAALGTLNPVGDTTAIARGLEEALSALEGAEEPLRHIVLFTDGWDPNEATLLPTARAIAEAGVTLSVLGTGEGPGVTLQRMAEVGGGRYYAGENLDEIPEIFVEETLQVARSLAQEGTFVPALGASSPVTEDLTATPPLGGFVLTKSKPTARVPLVIAEQDPLYATWQRGLGRVSAWTADATARWAADWIVWDGFVDFWGTLVEDVVPPGRDTPPSIEVRGAELAITYTAPDAPGSAAASATVRAPDGDTTTVPLVRGSDGTFAGTAPAGVLGAYWVSVAVEDGGSLIASGSSGAVSAYSDEFAFRSADPTLAMEMADISGGRVDPAPGGAFDQALELGRTERGIWPWLAGLAMLLFLADVALRRLVVFADDADVEGAAGPDTARTRRVEFVPDREPEPDPGSATLGRLLDRRRRG
ncbi:MAG: VWA domain-containing protein [Acidimicrobiia bacterium]|nr:VWA domain-containing protein [Acidimicrobiia bacterium]